jgi:hypothetical protein
MARTKALVSGAEFYSTVRGQLRIPEQCILDDVVEDTGGQRDVIGYYLMAVAALRLKEELALFLRGDDSSYFHALRRIHDRDVVVDLEQFSLLAGEATAALGDPPAEGSKRK